MNDKILDEFYGSLTNFVNIVSSSRVEFINLTSSNGNIELAMDTGSIYIIENQINRLTLTAPDLPNYMCHIMCNFSNGAQIDLDPSMSYFNSINPIVEGKYEINILNGSVMICRGA